MSFGLSKNIQGGAFKLRNTNGLLVVTGVPSSTAPSTRRNLDSVEQDNPSFKSESKRTLVMVHPSRVRRAPKKWKTFFAQNCLRW